MSFTSDVAENRRLWIEALRSGNYQQGTGRLKLENRYCCLGVACDISGSVEWDRDDLAIPSPPCNSYIPEGVAESLNLHTNAQDSLVKLNDHDARSFEAIATYIEALPYDY